MFHRIFALAAILALAVSVTTAAAAEPETEAANAAVAYIKSLQNADGGFPAFGEESSPGATLDAVFALVAVGVDPLAVASGGNSPADYLATQADTYSVDAGAAAKLMLGVVAMGLDPTDFGELDLPSVLEGHLAEDPSTGVYGLDLFDQALYILALAGAGEPVPDAATQHLRSARADDGGWEFSPGSGSDSNTTALVLQALVAAGAPADDHAVAVALGYLRQAQNADGGFGFMPGEESDPNSTAFALQALAAAGADIDDGGSWAPDGNTPLEGLLAFWNPASGAFQFAGVDSPFATYQAVPALMLAPFPDLETRVFEEPTPLPTATDLIPVEASPTPTATATSEPGILPPTGGGSAADGGQWWALAVLLAGGAVATAAGVAGRRFR